MSPRVKLNLSQVLSTLLKVIVPDFGCCFPLVYISLRMIVIHPQI